QVSPHGQAGGNTLDGDSHRGEHAREVGGGGFALDVGVGGDDRLLDLAIGQAAHQFADAQVVGADAVDRIDRAAEHVVPPAELPGAFDGHHVLGFFHDAQQAGVAAWIA